MAISTYVLAEERFLAMSSCAARAGSCGTRHGAAARRAAGCCRAEAHRAARTSSSLRPAMAFWPPAGSAASALLEAGGCSCTCTGAGAGADGGRGGRPFGSAEEEGTCCCCPCCAAAAPLPRADRLPRCCCGCSCAGAGASCWEPLGGLGLLALEVVPRLALLPVAWRLLAGGGSGADDGADAPDAPAAGCCGCGCCSGAGLFLELRLKPSIKGRRPQATATHQRRRAAALGTGTCNASGAAFSNLFA